VRTLQAIAEKMRDSDIDQGHAGADVQWGRYEVLARVAVESLKTRLAGTVCEAALNSILGGKS
jgi:hypothetical protein